MKSKQLEPAAGYVRMSSDKQEASPARQRAELAKLAAAHGCEIAQWYEDLGKTGTESKKRSGFQDLLRDCEKRKWRSVFYFEPSRLSREHPLDSLAHLNTFRKAGVRLISTTRGEVSCNDIGGLIMSMVDAHGAHDESIKLAVRSVSGRRKKVERGERVSGTPLFAFDREFFNEAGEVMRRVHFRERFVKPPNWQHRLVVSADLEAVAAVREAFRRVLAGDLIEHITHDWNERGITTTHGNQFIRGTLMGMLRNPVYCGTLMAGKWSSGKFSRMDSDGILWKENAHEAIVSKRLFEAVQAELDRRHRCYRRSAPGQYLLGTLVECHHCGGRMYGLTATSSGRRHYASPRKIHSASCPRMYVNADTLEEVILGVLRQYILTPGNVRRMRKDRIADGLIGTDEPDPAARQLAELERKIENGTANLLLAESPKDYKAMSDMLNRWRDQAEKLRGDLSRSAEFELERSEAVDAVDALSDMADHLHLCDRYKLAALVQCIVSRVVIGEKWNGQGKYRHRELFGTVEFDPGIWPGGPIALENSDLTLPSHLTWTNVAEYVCSQGRPVSFKEVVANCGVSSALTAARLGKAVAAGKLKNLGRKRGYVAAVICA